jgi:DNA-binding transcriptional LysR family regulator
MDMTRLTNLDVRHLLALTAVVEEGTFGGAADSLGFSQAAISQQIAALEKVLGQPVFDRPGGPRRPTLTPAGEVFLVHARAILARLDMADSQLTELATGRGGLLRVGTFQSASVKLLPSVVSTLKQESPGLDITLVESDDNPELIEKLLAGELDVSFVVGPIIDDRLETVHLATDPFVIVTHIDDPAAREARFPLKALDGLGTIGQEQNSSCQVLIENNLRAAGVTPKFVFRSNDNGAVQAMVRAGMGPAVMPLLTLDLNDPTVRVLPLDPPVPPREILIAYSKQRTHPPVADRFIEIAVATCSDSTWPHPSKLAASAIR